MDQKGHQIDPYSNQPYVIRDPKEPANETKGGFFSESAMYFFHIAKINISNHYPG